MRTVAGVFDEFAAGLEFPGYFGRNWDAFEECLSGLDDWLDLGSGLVLVIVDALEVLADETHRLAVLVSIIESARRTYSEPIVLSECWDRSAVPFHVLLQVSAADVANLRRHWPKAADHQDC
jgi:hypothetical protein